MDPAIVVHDIHEGCDFAVESDKPVIVQLEEKPDSAPEDALWFKCFPSRRYQWSRDRKSWSP
jgi:hypothetical protein